MGTGALNLLLGRLPSYTRKGRHLQLLGRYGRPYKLANIVMAETSRLRGDLVSKGRPYVYTIDIGNVCNLRCPLCPTGYHGLERPQALMRLSTFRAVLDKIKPYAVEVILHNWGEPTLNPDLLEIISAAKEEGVGTTISSNLNLVHRGDEFLHALVDCGLDHLTVSIDGTTQDVYETYRRGGDLAAVLRNLRELLRYRNEIGSRTPTVEWQFLVMKHNEHQMEEARRLSSDVGVDRLRFTAAGLPFDELVNMDLAAQWLPENPAYHTYHPSTIDRQGYLYDERCFYLYRAMTINPDGGVAPCCAVYHGDSDFGNLVEDSLDDVWNNGHYRSSRALFSHRESEDRVDTICGRCPLFKYESRGAIPGARGRVAGTSVPRGDAGRCEVPGGEAKVAAARGSVWAGRDVAYRVATRVLDVTVSMVVLALLSPLMLAIAVLIKLDSPGPALFRQARRGKRPSPGSAHDPDEERLGRPFTLYKFRTMAADSRERFPDLYRYSHTEDELRTLPIKVLVSCKDGSANAATHPDFASGMVTDPRLTRVGRWLRRTSLDELPNFLSVLKGDMTLVGPRPDIVENIRYYSPEHLRKLDVKPGITGLAQVMGRGHLSFLETNDYDVRYVEDQSFLLDLKVLLRTIPIVMRRDGAY